MRLLAYALQLLSKQSLPNEVNEESPHRRSPEGEAYEVTKETKKVPAASAQPPPRVDVPKRVSPGGPATKKDEESPPGAGMWLAVVGPKDAPPPDPFAAFPPEVQAELAALRAVLDATRSWCDPSNLPLLDTLWQQAVEDQAPDGPAAVRALLEHLVLPLLTRWLAAREANPR